MMIKRLDKKSRLLIEVIIFSLFISIVTTSWAYFTFASVTQGKQNVVTAGSMQLTFNDGAKITKESMMPGESITKSFKVKNTGSIDASYDVYFSEVINTFADKKDLVYTVDSNNGCTKLNEANAPSESGEKLVNLCSIASGEEHSYILTITFKETNDNQNDNQGKEFSAKLSVNEFKTTEGIEIANNYIEEANRFYTLNSTSNELGNNIATSLNVNNKVNGDQVVVTKDGKIELAVQRNNLCFRKSALRDEVEVLEASACNVDMTKFVSNNGHLHVCGTYLCSEDNKEVRITGASTSGIGAPDGFTTPIRGEINTESLHTLHNWGANGLRSFGVASISGFANFIGHEDEYINSFKKIIDAAIENDMYIIANWDPARNDGASFTDNAVDFFTRIANLYPNDPHIIYEIWNEPENNNTWEQVNAHANTVIPAIRAISPDAVIIVGNPKFDSLVNEAKDHPLDYDNIMYSAHAYMGGVSDESIQKIKDAMDNGTAVFVTEWGTMGLKREDPMVIAAHATSYLGFLNKYRLSNMQFCFATSTDENDNRYGIVLRGQWDNSLPDSILKPNGKFLKNSLSGGTGGYNSYLLKGNPDSGDYGDDYRSEEYRDKIVSITFANTKEVPQNLVHTFDLSFAQDNTIVGYVVSTLVENQYDLIIAADGDITLPTNCNYLFARMQNLKSIDFTNVKSDYVSIFNAVFIGDKSLDNLDLSNIDSTRITQLWNTFANCSSITSIDLSSWNAKITTMGWTFNGCTKLTNLNLSGLDVSAIKDFGGLFYNNTSLKTLDLSSWKPNTVTGMSQMFRYDKSLETVDIRYFDITSTTSLDRALDGIKAGTKFIVKNSEVGQYIQDNASVTITYQVAS